MASRPGLHGLALHEGQAYLATPNQVFRADVLLDGTLGPLEMVIHDLPDAGQHNTRTLQIGPDNMLYISIGSTCNECGESNPESATLLRASLDGKRRAVWASGLRDTIGWGWHPRTDPAHSYHTQVFALDRLLEVPLTGADRDRILSAMNGHVLARGELTGTFARPDAQVSRP